MGIVAAGLDFSTLQGQNWKNLLRFVTENRGHLTGRVLDFGCGKKPYEHLCTGAYVEFDPGFGAELVEPEGVFSTILITQVLQFVDDPRATIEMLRRHLKPNGIWMITYAASWYEVQPEDTWRITKLGMERLLRGTVLSHAPVTTIDFVGFSMNLCYGIICRNTDPG